MPNGWHSLAKSQSINADGFFAEAFQDANGNTVISFCGSVIDYHDFDGSVTPYSLRVFGSAWARGSQAADLTILKGGHPAAFDDALQFTQSVINNNHLDPSKVFLSGHSLGGAEAEYVGLAYNVLGIKLGGGATFAAPGISKGPENPQGAGSDQSFNFKNYIDHGDPVANYNDHYGQNIFVGNINDQHNTDIIDGLATIQLADTSRLAQAIDKNLFTFIGALEVLTPTINVIDILQQHHGLNNYDNLIA
jgi:hypothetical protein